MVTIGTLQESNIIGHAQNAAGSFNQAKANEVDDLAKYEAELKKYSGDNGVVLDELSKYILGANGEGRNLSEIVDNTFTFKQDPADSTSKVHEKLKLGYIELEGQVTTLYIRYNRDVYKLEISVNFENEEPLDSARTIKGTLAFVNTPEGNLGKYVKYADNIWIVLRDDENGVELISANGLGNLKIYTGNGQSDYNNAVSTIVNQCKIETGITNNIRNVGGPAAEEEKLSDDNTVLFRDLKNFQPTVSYENFTQYEGEENGLRKEDSNYLSDYNQMKHVGIVYADNMAFYWLASREIEQTSDSVFFNVRNVGSLLESDRTFGVQDNAKPAWLGTPWNYAVRPIVKLESGILNNASQTGLIDDPIILN